MSKDVEEAMRELYSTRPAARRRRTHSWNGPLLPIIMEDDLESEADGRDCPSSSQDSNTVLRSISEQHPASKYGRDILALVSNQQSIKTSSEESETQPLNTHAVSGFGEMFKDKGQLEFKAQADSVDSRWGA